MGAGRRPDDWNDTENRRPGNDRQPLKKNLTSLYF